MVVHCANVLREVFVERCACVSKIMWPPTQEIHLAGVNFDREQFWPWYILTGVNFRRQKKQPLEEKTLPHTKPPRSNLTAVNFDRGQFWPWCHFDLGQFWPGYIFDEKKTARRQISYLDRYFFYVCMYGGGPPRSLRTLIKDLLREKMSLNCE